MNPVELLLRARALVTQRPFDLPALAELFATCDGLLESELAAAWAVAHMPHAPVFEWLQHVDPLERDKAVRFAESLGSPGARFLRAMTRDPVERVARRARGAARRLDLRDVAPPDRDGNKLYDRGTPFEVGKWNVSGWSAGYRRPFRVFSSRTIKVSGPTKPLKLGSRGALLAALNLTEDDVRRLSRPVGGKGSGYVEFQIPKRNGMRTIAAPKQKLKQAQRWLLDNLFAPLPLHAAAHGFRTGHSILTNAQPHVGAGLVVKLDLQNFFPSVHYRRVEGLLNSYGYAVEVSLTVAQLTTYRPKPPDGRRAWPGVLPQGAPTSPAIANLITRRLDARLTALGKKFGAVYTRYADDLTFSFKERHPQRLGRFLWWVNAVCQQEGFLENASKRRLLRSGSRQEVTGLVVNDKVTVPRHVRRRFKAMLFNIKRNGLAAEARGRNVHEFAAWLQGQAAYIAMVHPELGRKWLAEVKDIVARSRA
jgi:retron-type reverse transcriptase